MSLRIGGIKFGGLNIPTVDFDSVGLDKDAPCAWPAPSQDQDMAFEDSRAHLVLEIKPDKGRKDFTAVLNDQGLLREVLSLSPAPLTRLY